jgi:hypothetical protein
MSAQVKFQEDPTVEQIIAHAKAYPTHSATGAGRGKCGLWMRVRICKPPAYERPEIFTLTTSGGEALALNEDFRWDYLDTNRHYQWLPLQANGVPVGITAE